jgi:hypothetical protein
MNIRNFMCVNLCKFVDNGLFVVDSLFKICKTSLTIRLLSVMQIVLLVIALTFYCQIIGINN